MYTALIILSTKIASTPTFLLLESLITYLLYKKGLRKLSILLITTTVLMSLSIVGLKLFFAVPRPADALLTLSDYAFPSGHSAGVVFLALTTWWYISDIKQSTNRSLWAAGLITLVLLVSYSRLFFGVHTPSQLLAGYVIGGLFAALFLYVAQKLESKQPYMD